MLRQPAWTPQDPNFALDLLAKHPWVTLISSTPDGMVASHLVVYATQDEMSQMTVWGHLGVRDASLHGLGTNHALIVAQGPHGYISPAWYTDQTSVPTWDYTAVHITGTPVRLDQNTAAQVLHRTVSMMETPRPDPWIMDATTEMESLLPGIVAFRMPAAAVQAKAKLGQTRSADLHSEVLHGLETDAVYRNAALAEALRRARPGANVEESCRRDSADTERAASALEGGAAQPGAVQGPDPSGS